MDIEFGALVPRISEQLKQQGLYIDSMTVAEIQRDVDAVSLLYSRGILTDGERRNAERRLVQGIAKQAKRTE